MKQKKNILLGLLTIYGLQNLKNNRHFSYLNYNSICNYNIPIIHKKSYSSNNKKDIIIYFRTINKTGYLVSHPIQSGSNVIIHTLHILNADNTLFAIYKATSNDYDLDKILYWQKSVGYYAPMFFRGDILNYVYFYN